MGLIFADGNNCKVAVFAPSSAVRYVNVKTIADVSIAIVFCLHIIFVGTAVSAMIDG